MRRRLWLPRRRMRLRSWAEADLGTLVKGKLADIVILDATGSRRSKYAPDFKVIRMARSSIFHRMHCVSVSFRHTECAS
jgi:predicted amidohydrolase YtcJ